MPFSSFRRDVDAPVVETFDGIRRIGDDVDEHLLQADGARLDHPATVAEIDPQIGIGRFQARGDDLQRIGA